MSESSSTSHRSIFWLGLHWIIILHFLIEIGYCAYMIFVTLRPDGVSGPLGEQALSISHELMVTRRLYAIECWIATAGLVIYLALTEPRLTNRTLNKSDI